MTGGAPEPLYPVGGTSCLLDAGGMLAPQYTDAHWPADAGAGGCARRRGGAADDA